MLAEERVDLVILERTCLDAGAGTEGGRVMREIPSVIFVLFQQSRRVVLTFVFVDPIASVQDQQCREFLDAERLQPFGPDLDVARGVKVERLVKVGREGFVQRRHLARRREEERDRLDRGLQRLVVDAIEGNRTASEREREGETRETTDLGFQGFEVVEGGSPLDKRRHRARRVRDDVLGRPRSVVTCETVARVRFQESGGRRGRCALLGGAEPPGKI